jgi:hypothetical protein
VKLSIVAVGQRQPAWADQAVADYLGRFPADFSVTLKEVKPEPRNGAPVERLLAGGDDTMAATAVGSAASATNFSATAVDITPARQQHVADVGDWGVQSLTEITNIDEAIDLMAVLVNKGTTAWTNRYTALLLALISSLSVTAGTTVTDLTWYKLFAGIVAARDRGNTGRGLIVLNSTALLKLATDLTSVSNAYALANIARKIVESPMDGGSVAADINGCDLMMLSGLPTSGSDTYGAILFPGVWASKHVNVPFPAGVASVYNIGVHRCEAVRGAGTDVSSYSFTSHVGVAEADDNRGTRIIWAT